MVVVIVADKDGVNGRKSLDSAGWGVCPDGAEVLAGGGPGRENGVENAIYGTAGRSLHAGRELNKDASVAQPGDLGFALRIGQFEIRLIDAQQSRRFCTGRVGPVGDVAKVRPFVLGGRVCRRRAA